MKAGLRFWSITVGTVRVLRNVSASEIIARTSSSTSFSSGMGEYVVGRRVEVEGWAEEERNFFVGGCCCWCCVEGEGEVRERG